MRICPRCRTTVADHVVACPNDGRRPLPREVVDAAGGDPLLGATLAGRYTLVGRVGAGGMGTVYRAEQSPLGREVALKVLRRELGRDAETVARFTREARMLSQLRHPNTVAIFDFGQSDEGLLYLAMELLEGEMLSSRLRRVGSLGVEEATRIAKGVLRSLDEAHARGIVHRDLKPDNIFLARVHGRPDEAEVVKVVDFGIAKIRDGELTQGLDPVATQEGTVFGTPRYMSPEQAQGKSLDGRSDLYAVGVLLFHMLTGQAPFTDDDAVIVMAHHIKTVPPGVRELAPNVGIPPSLEALVARALAKSPDDRPQTADEFLSELTALDEEVRAAVARSVLSTEETAVIHVTPQPRRAWVGVAVATASVLVALAGFTLFATRGPESDRAARPAAHATREPTPPPVAPAEPPPPAAPAEPAPAAPAAPEAAPPATPAAPVDARSPSEPGSTRRRARGGAQRVAPPRVVAAPPTTPTPSQPAPRRTSQPYQTFEGM